MRSYAIVRFTANAKLKRLPLIQGVLFRIPGAFIFHFLRDLAVPGVSVFLEMVQSS